MNTEIKIESSGRNYGKTLKLIKGILKEEIIESHCGEYYITQTKLGWKVFQNGETHAVRVATCGYKGVKGLLWCQAEIDRRGGVSRKWKSSLER